MHLSRELRHRPAWALVLGVSLVACSGADRDTPGFATFADGGDAGESEGVGGAESADDGGAGSDGAGADDGADGTTAGEGPGDTGAADEAGESGDAGESESGGGAGEDGQFWLLPPALEAPDMTPDGSIVLMTHLPDGLVFEWTEAGGIEQVANAELPARAISDDGTRIAGSLYDANDHEMAAIWDEGIGWTELGDLGEGCDAFYSTGYDMSGDGSIVVGLGWQACKGVATWWEQGAGMSGLAVLELGNNRASTISHDGKVAAGFAQTTNRTPALWWDDGSTLVPDGGMVGEFHAISMDGTLAAGTALQQALYWTADEGLVMLGNLEPLGPFEHTRFLGVCNGGQLLIGSEGAMFGTGTAIAWTAEDGLMSFADYLAMKGVDVPADVSVIERAVSCNADGTRIAGTAMHGVTGLQAFVVDVPAAPM